ncbi:hypothetical protein CU669_09855 [Paramagnetospirillum kuznetsovii]|uniref:Uncharacterized protein n=1 Tax=Paramagnetospirillum kuznetsovii TaxID=2053833 RepID=A0A364NY35_9PROT|nr:hypothetical protein CU669_09855 [Paramagnetospirillum kuznetsovii]
MSDTGRQLIEADDEQALIAFTRKTLACPRLRECPYGDYCTIFAASLLSERGKHPHECEDY